MPVLYLIATLTMCGLAGTSWYFAFYHLIRLGEKEWKQHLLNTILLGWLGLMCMLASEALIKLVV